MQEKEEEGRKRGGGCVTFFKGIINSLSALVCYILGPIDIGQEVHLTR